MTIFLPYLNKLSEFASVCGKNAKSYVKPMFYGLIIFWIIFQIFQPVSGDLPLYAMRAMQFLTQEGNFYTDVFEVSTPMVFWFLAPPIWLAMQLGLHSSYFVEVLHAWGVMWSAIIIWLCSRALLYQRNIKSAQRRGILAVIAISILAFFNFNSFADREFYICLFLLPPTLMLGVRACGFEVPRAWRVGLALLAACAIMIKPQVIVLWAALHLPLLLQYRSRYFAAFLLETLVMLAAGIIYGGLVWWTQPDYFEHVLPLMLESYKYYTSLDDSFVMYMTIFCACALAVVYDAKYNKPHQTPFYPHVLLGIFGMLGGIAYIRVGNGWWYTYEPIYFSLILTGIWLFISYQWQDEKQDGYVHYKRGMNGLLIVLTLKLFAMLGIACINISSVWFPDEEQASKLSGKERVYQLMGREGAKTIAIVDEQTLLGIPILMKYGVPFNHFASTYWMVSKLNIDTERGLNVKALKEHPLFHFIADSYVRELQRLNPDMVLVGAGYPPRMIDKLMHDERFVAIMQRYKKREAPLQFDKEAGACNAVSMYKYKQEQCLFDVYVRNK